MIRTGSLLACALVGLGTPAAAQSWAFTSARDPFTDLTTYRAHQTNRARSLNVRCKDDRLEVYLVLIGYLGDGADVRYRFDSGPVSENSWEVSLDRSGVFVPGPGEFARKLMTGSVLHIEITGEYGSPDRFTISLAGSSGPVGRVLDGCGVPRTEIYVENGPIWRRAVEALDAATRDEVETVAQAFQAAGTYSGPVDRVRRRELYQALSNFYEGYWLACQEGTVSTSSCQTWLSSKRYNPTADYPKEPLELLAEVLEAPARPPAEAPRPSVITNPGWARQPSPQFPERALAAGILSGVVRVSCTIQPNGAVTDCRVASEDPPNAGFGAAALSSMRSSRLTAATISSAAPGARIEVNIRFQAPAD